MWFCLWLNTGVIITHKKEKICITAWVTLRASPQTHTAAAWEGQVWGVRLNAFSFCIESPLCWINPAPIKLHTHKHSLPPLYPFPFSLSFSLSLSLSLSLTHTALDFLNRECLVTDNSYNIFLMRHLPGCRAANSLVDSAEQPDTLQPSGGRGHIRRAREGERDQFWKFLPVR